MDDVQTSSLEHVARALRDRFGDHVSPGLATREQHSRGEDLLLVGMPDAFIFPNVISSIMTLQAGVRLQVAQELAADSGLLSANDLGTRGSALVGGIISTNAGGLKAVRYGTTRDQVLGLEAVLTDSRIADCMTATIKNNTGIDLKHMFIGSEGTLGAVTRAVLRLRPLMTHSRTALVGCETFDHVARLLSFMQAELGGAWSSFEAMWATSWASSPRQAEPVRRWIALGP